MGDASIETETNNEAVKTPRIEKVEEKLEEIMSKVASPRSANGDTPEPETPKTPEVEELHRSNNKPIDTPEPSSLSMESPRVTVEMPQNSNLSPNRVGKRNFRVGTPSVDNEYGLPVGPAAGLGPQVSASPINGEIFSIRGTRSFKLNRHRDNVTVFPSGCMGVPNEQESAEVSDTPPVSPVPALEQPEITKSSIGTLHRPSSAARNPLTGEGYMDANSKQRNMFKKPDGNPVLGSGYNEKSNTRPSKVPPGGFSKGLW